MLAYPLGRSAGTGVVDVYRKSHYVSRNTPYCRDRKEYVRGPSTTTDLTMLELVPTGSIFSSLNLLRYNFLVKLSLGILIQLYSKYWITLQLVPSSV
jgi:hypothetical protein